MRSRHVSPGSVAAGAERDMLGDALVAGAVRGAALQAMGKSATRASAEARVILRWGTPETLDPIPTSTFDGGGGLGLSYERR